MPSDVWCYRVVVRMDTEWGFTLQPAFRSWADYNHYWWVPEGMCTCIWGLDVDLSPMMPFLTRPNSPDKNEVVARIKTWVDENCMNEHYS